MDFDGNGSAVAIPIFSTDSGELEHPILGKFSVEIRASSSEDIEMHALATCGDKYICRRSEGYPQHFT